MIKIDYVGIINKVAIGLAYLIEDTDGIGDLFGLTKKQKFRVRVIILFFIIFRI
ncbi:MAG: hypothetical protein AAGG59_12615 [Bacteroidota bacterium]